MSTELWLRSRPAAWRLVVEGPKCGVSPGALPYLNYVPEEPVDGQKTRDAYDAAPGPA